MLAIMCLGIALVMCALGVVDNAHAQEPDFRDDRHSLDSINASVSLVPVAHIFDWPDGLDAQNRHLVLVGSAFDGQDGFEELDGARGVAITEISNGTYAVVASRDDAGIQVIDLTDPYNPAPAASLTDGQGGFNELDGARGVAITEISGRTYAVVASWADSGIQVIDLTDPRNPAPVSSATDGQGGFEELGNAAGITVAGIYGRAYTVVASPRDSGIQVIDLTDPRNPVPVSSATDGQGGFEELYGARGVAIAEISGRTYAVIASQLDSGIQVIDLTDPHNPAPVASLTDGQGGFDGLDGAYDVAIAEISGGTYAVVASAQDDGVQVIDMGSAGPSGHAQTTSTIDAVDTAQSSIVPVASVFDGRDGFEALDGVYRVEAAQISGRTYVMAASAEEGIQVVDITDPAAPSPTSAILDADYPEDYGAVRDIEVVQTPDGAYALVARGHAVQVIDVSNPADPREVAVVRDGQMGFTALDDPRDISVYEASGLTYALVTGEDEDAAIQVLNLTDPRSPRPASHHLAVKRSIGEPSPLFAVDTMAVSGGTYAVAARWPHNSIQVIDLTNPNLPRVTATIFDRDGDFALAYVYDIEVVTRPGGQTHVLAASSDDHGIQIIEIIDPDHPRPVASAIDGRDGFDALAGVYAVEAATVSGRNYAVAVSRAEDAVQLIDITDPWTPKPAGSVFDGEGGFDALDGASDVAVAKIGGRTYAVVAGFEDDGIQIMNITDLAPGTDAPPPPGAIPPFEFALVETVLDLPLGLSSGTLAGAILDADYGEYVIMAGSLQFETVDVTDPASPKTVRAVNKPADTPDLLTAIQHCPAVADYIPDLSWDDITNFGSKSTFDDFEDAAKSKKDTTRLFGVKVVKGSVFEAVYASAGVALGCVHYGAWDVDTITHYETERPHALVSDSWHGRLHVLDVENAVTPWILDAGVHSSSKYFDALAGARGVAGYSVKGHTYAVVASAFDDAVQIVDITDRFDPHDAGSALDGQDGFDALGGAWDVDTTVISGRTYAVVASYGDDAVQVIDITNPRAPVPVASVFDNEDGFSLDGARTVKTANIQGRDYAIVASVHEDAVQIIDITDPASPAAVSSVRGGQPGFDALDWTTGGREALRNTVEKLEGDIAPDVLAELEADLDRMTAYLDTNQSGLDSVEEELARAVDRLADLAREKGSLDTEQEAVLWNAEVSLHLAWMEELIRILELFRTGTVDPDSGENRWWEGIRAILDIGASKASGISVVDKPYGTYAVVASNVGVQVIDITDPASPRPAGSLRIGEGVLADVEEVWDVEVIGPALGTTYVLVMGS